MRINAVEPGVSPATNLGHDANPILRFIAGIVVAVLAGHVKFLTTPERAAQVITIMLKAMADRGSRIVYATGIGRVCPTCGWPEQDCHCSSKFARSQPLPEKVVAKLRLETKGRGGKTVTVVYDLPNNAEFLKSLATELKKACGTGGTIAKTPWKSRATTATGSVSC